jgi:hypothetical protein
VRREKKMRDRVNTVKGVGELDRREFTARSVLALLSGVVVTVSGCGGSGGGGGGAAGGAGDDGYTPTGPGPVEVNGVSGSVSANHGHTATVTDAQLSAGAMVSINIRGDANHNHVVELSADEVSQIAAGQRVVKRSSNEDSHFHEVTFN